MNEPIKVMQSFKDVNSLAVKRSQIIFKWFFFLFIFLALSFMHVINIFTIIFKKSVLVFYILFYTHMII